MPKVDRKRVDDRLPGNIQHITYELVDALGVRDHDAGELGILRVLVGFR